MHLRPTLHQGPGSNFLGTNLDWFEANWILSWTVRWSLAWLLVLQIKNSPSSIVFWFEPIDFLSKTGRFNFNLPLFGLGPSFKGLGTNLKLWTNKIAWIHWSLDLGPSSKVAFKARFTLGVRRKKLGAFEHIDLSKVTLNAFLTLGVRAKKAGGLWAHWLV